MRLVAFVSALAVLGVAVPAVAEDPPAKPAAGAATTRRAKIANGLLLDLVGAWEAQAPDGAEGKTPRSSVRWSTVLDGTALVEEATAGETRTLSVLYVDSTGAGVSVWRFHSENPGETMTQKGTLSETVLDLQSEGNLPGLRLERKKDEIAVTTSFGGAMSTTLAYRRKTEAPVPAGETPTTHPFLGSLSGDFAVAGTMKMGDKEFHQTGTASLSATAGGAFSRTDYEALAGQEKKLGLGIAGLAADGKTFHYWWFTDHFDAPTLVSGEATDREWKGKGEFFGPFDMSWKRTDAGLQIDAVFSGATMQETFTRKE